MRRRAKRRRARRPASELRVSWKGWLAVAVIGCFAALAGAVLLGGVGWLRDIERTENMLVAGWIAVAALSIFITMAVSLLRRKKRLPPHLRKDA